MKHHQDRMGKTMIRSTKLEGVCKELREATVGNTNSGLSYSEFVPLKGKHLAGVFAVSIGRSLGLRCESLWISV